MIKTECPFDEKECEKESCSGCETKLKAVEGLSYQCPKRDCGITNCYHHSPHKLTEGCFNGCFDNSGCEIYIK